MGSSIATGVARLPDELEGVLIMLCDQWQVESRDFERLIESWFSDISGIHVSAWTSSKTSIQGPPAIFPRTLFHELKNLKVDEGARALIARYSERVQAVKMENAAADLDVPDDLQQLINANRSFGNK